MAGSFMSARAAVKMTIEPLMLTTRQKRHTLNLRNLIVNDLFELSLRDTIAEEDGPLGEGLIAVDTSLEFVVDVHTDAVLMQYVPSSASLRTSGTDTKIALTFTISSVSSIISCLLFWTFEMAMYRLYIGSMLATMDVKLGLLSTPGAGWITSAPMMMAGFWGSERMGTERASGTALTPPSFTLTLKHNQRQLREKMWRVRT